MLYKKKFFGGVNQGQTFSHWGWVNPPKILTLAAFPMYLFGGFTQTPQNLSILWLQFQLMHTLFLLERERFPLATSGGLFSPGAVTVASHTRMNLKRQVNCCSLRINRAIYSACLFGFFFLLLLPFLGFSIFLCSSFFFQQPVENVWGGSIGLSGCSDCSANESSLQCLLSRQGCEGVLKGSLSSCFISLQHSFLLFVSESNRTVGKPWNFDRQCNIELSTNARLVLFHEFTRQQFVEIARNGLFKTQLIQPWECKVYHVAILMAHSASVFVISPSGGAVYHTQIWK